MLISTYERASRQKEDLMAKCKRAINDKQIYQEKCEMLNEKIVKMEKREY